MLDGDDACPSAGSRGTHLWSVTTRDAHRFKVFGELVFTPKGTALVYCDCGVSHLLVGLANGRWGSIVAEE
jgi:hypothetical protein